MYGSFQNRVMEASPAPQDIKVGDGATVTMYTDRYACTVIKVERTLVVLQEDTATRTDSNGMCDSQAYEYTPNPNGAQHVFTLRRNGRWVEQGYKAKDGPGVIFGVRRKFHDYSF